MSLHDLLPSNSTQLERDFSRVTSSLQRASRPVGTIRTAKRVDIPESVIPWLIYEYGLQELLPYLKDPRQAIREGVLWQRIRGTKAALEQALGWIDYPATIEESESLTLRWAEFQLALDAHPASFDAIDDVVAVSKLSAPARSRNFRIYNGYDERRFRLDYHVLGEGLLCDHSGVIVREDWPQLSFGRKKFRTKSFTEDFNSQVVETKILAFEGLYEDKFILSHSRVDEWWHLLDEGISTGARLHFKAYPPLEINCQIYPPLKYAWTGIYLSDDGWYLDDTHAAFSHRKEVEVGDIMRLSDLDPITKQGALSEQTLEREFREITKRFESDHFTSTEAPTTTAGHLALHSRAHATLAEYEDRFLLDYGILDEQWHLADRLSRDVQHTFVDTYLGFRENLTWLDDLRWVDDVTWQEPTQLNVTTDEKAGIYLSEENKFGETLFRFHVERTEESFPGALVLDGAEPLEPGEAIELQLSIEDQMQPFRLSEADAGTGLGLLSNHLGVDAIEALPTDPDWMAVGWNRLSQHVVSLVGLGYTEVFDHLFFTAFEHDRTTIGVDGTATATGRITQREHFFWLEYEDNFVLDAGQLDEAWHLQDFLFRAVDHTRSVTIYPVDAFNAQTISSYTSFEKAGVTLDEEFIFGDTNSRFPVELTEETEPGALVLSEAEPVEHELDLFVPIEGEMERFLLSEADPSTGWGVLGGHIGPDTVATLVTEEFLAVGNHRLSQHRIAIRTLGRAEVFDRIHQVSAGDDRSVAVETARASTKITAAIYEDSFLLDAGLLDEQWHLIDVASRDAERTSTWRYFAFDDVTWGFAGFGWSPDFSWQQLRRQQITFFTSYEKAAIYLDESTLGDTNDRFSFEHYEETQPGAFLLSEAEPVASEQILVAYDSEQIEVFALSDGDPATGFGILSEHRSPTAIAQEQETPEFLALGNNRLSQHIHRYVRPGFNEVFDRTPYQNETTDNRRFEIPGSLGTQNRRYFVAVLDDARSIEITSRTAERYVDTLDDRRSIPEASRTRAYQKWATEDPDGIDITSRTAERYWLTLDEIRYADAEIASRTAERYVDTLDERRSIPEASRTRAYQKWAVEDPDGFTEASRTAERYWLTLDEYRYLETEISSRTAERYRLTLDDRRSIPEASRTRVYDKWATEDRQAILVTGRSPEHTDTGFAAAHTWATAPFTWEEPIPWAAETLHKMDETTEDVFYITASWSDISRTAERYRTAEDERGEIDGTTRVIASAKPVFDFQSTIEESAGEILLTRVYLDQGNSTIEEAAGHFDVTATVIDSRGGIDVTATEIVSTRVVEDDLSTIVEASGEITSTTTADFAIDTSITWSEFNFGWQTYPITWNQVESLPGVADETRLGEHAQQVLDENHPVEEEANETVFTNESITEQQFFGWDGGWSSTIKWNPTVEMIDTDRETST